MAFKIKIFFGITCSAMVIYLFWTMSTVTQYQRQMSPPPSILQYMNGNMKYDINETRTGNKTQSGNKTADTTKPLSGNKTGDITKTQNENKTSDIIEPLKGNQTRDITKIQISNPTSDITKIQNGNITRTLNYTVPPTLVNSKDINPEIEAFFTLKANESRDKFVNLHQYQFSINSRICSNDDIFLIMIVHSAPRNSRKRSLIRTTYGSVRSYRGKKMAVVFMLAAVKDHTIQDSLNTEAKQYGDIVQGNFVDSYKSLIRKHVMAMHWFKYHCDADFILKLDDDTFVNPFRTVEYILGKNPLEPIIYGHFMSGDPPDRRRKSKWYTALSQYPFPILPEFCLGFAYITTPATWAALYQASKTSRAIDMDDVYVSAVLAMKAQVYHATMNSTIYVCQGKTKLIDVVQLQAAGIFMDPKSSCGEGPFRLWNKIL